MPLGLPAQTPSRRGRMLRHLAFAGLTLTAPLFFIGGPEWTDGPVFKSAWNLGHILFFALFTLAVQPWRIWYGWRLWGICTLAVLIMGMGVELLQYGTSRQMDGQDILRNQLGVWTVLAARPLASQTVRSSLAVWSLRLLVLVLLAVEAGAIARVTLQQYEVSQLLPALYDFSQTDPSPFWSGAVTPATPGAGHNPQGGLRLFLTTARYSGASLHNFPGDWQGYDRFVIDLYNPQDHPVTVTLRINDVEHDLGDNAYNDRFNTRLTLAPGPNRFHLDLEQVRNAPAGRTMNMREVRRLVLFTSGLRKPKTLYVRDIKLE